jgi:hypothetical protein
MQAQRISAWLGIALSLIGGPLFALNIIGLVLSLIKPKRQIA